ncbi:galactosyltransferase-related protein [Pseudomonas sp. Irchel s3h17]|uniref:galactosyltransferase-related protein n=1 Tax=Pseudomonas sp. Irchel s3h17 TaxID=2009182 RepID=UPI000BA34A65|nr:galactosyltransferase-related protein [Pseudomonas sp. Irchel s3h17]
MKGELSAVECLASLTAIVPLDLQFRANDIIAKAKLMAEQSQGSSLKIVFAHNDRETKFDARLRYALSGYKDISLISGKFYEGAVNPALLRNMAFAEVSTKYLVLLDVDLWLDQGLLRKYLGLVCAGVAPFSILPCLYLTLAGSMVLMSGKRSIEQLRADYFAFSRKEFLHLANPSSIVVMRSTDYESLNGFNVEFSGHGYEDFDFLIRLASLHLLISPSPDFLSNATMRSPLFAQGFRRELGRLCLDALLEKDFFFHIFHEKNTAGNQHSSSRKNNFLYFREIHKEYSEGQNTGDPTLITAFIEKCLANGKNIHDYSIYFENKPGHVDRYDTFRRRMKFLIK